MDKHECSMRSKHPVTACPECARKMVLLNDHIPSDWGLGDCDYCGKIYVSVILKREAERRTLSIPLSTRHFQRSLNQHARSLPGSRLPQMQ